MQKDQSRKPPASWGSIQAESVSGANAKWRQRSKKVDQPLAANTTLTLEQQQIRKLQRELRDAQMERDILKKVVNGPPPLALPVSKSPIFSDTTSSAGELCPPLG